ncbi:MAG: hypothetical protein QXK86_06420 [Candidatus Bathyarchaeia archaeon]
MSMAEMLKKNAFPILLSTLVFVSLFSAKAALFTAFVFTLFIPV